MAWFKVDDKLHSHKKAARAGEAMALWVIAGSWCADQLTDGFVPDYIAARLIPDGADLADRLVKAGLWSEGEHDGDAGWWFHDWEDFQPTRDEVESKREYERDKKRRQRRSPAGQFEASTSESPVVSLGDRRGTPDGTPDGSREGVTPSRPDPSRTPEEPTMSDVPSDPDISQASRDLANEFRQAIRNNGHPSPGPNTKARQQWLIEMDRLRRIGPPGWDGDPPSDAEIRQVIAWACADEFEAANVRSIPKFRERYSQLRLKALNSTPAALTNVAKLTEGGRF